MKISYDIFWKSNIDIAIDASDVVNVASYTGDIIVETSSELITYKNTTVLIDLSQFINCFSLKSLKSNYGKILPISIDDDIEFYIEFGDSVKVTKFHPLRLSGNKNPLISELSQSDALNISKYLSQKVIRDISENCIKIKDIYNNIICI